MPFSFGSLYRKYIAAVTQTIAPQGYASRPQVLLLLLLGVTLLIGGEWPRDPLQIATRTTTTKRFESKSLSLCRMYSFDGRTRDSCSHTPKERKRCHYLYYWVSSPHTHTTQQRRDDKERRDREDGAVVAPNDSIKRRGSHKTLTRESSVVGGGETLLATVSS